VNNGVSDYGQRQSARNRGLRAALLSEQRVSWPHRAISPGGPRRENTRPAGSLDCNQVERSGIRSSGIPGLGKQMSDEARIRILSVDDHPLLRQGIAAIINSQPDMLMMAEASNGAEGIQKYREVQPDITLMDLRLPDMSGIDTLIAIRHEFADARVIMLTTFEGDVEMQRALEAGAYGYMLKTMHPKELLETIRQVRGGKKRVPPEVAAQLAEHFSDESLTEREIEVLRHISGGNRNRDIAQRLFISEETVKVHLRHIMEKLGASDRTQAVAIAVRRGIVQL
jgi:DNA-binding NarL/FixJ family response regulator